jgi:O-antigen/teichoic acid export membrane protein
MAAAGASILMVLIGEPLAHLIFGEQYRPAGALLRSLAPVLVLCSIWQFSLHVLTALGQERLVLRSSILSSGSIALLTLLLGPSFGLESIPLALIAGFATAAMYYLPALFRGGLVDLRRIRPVGLSGAAVLSILCLLTTRSWWPPEGVVSVLAPAGLLIVVFPASLALFRVLPARLFLADPRQLLHGWLRG